MREEDKMRGELFLFAYWIRKQSGGERGVKA